MTDLTHLSREYGSAASTCNIYLFIYADLSHNFSHIQPTSAATVSRSEQHHTRRDMASKAVMVQRKPLRRRSMLCNLAC
jgi:hypothetical protein